MLLESYLNKRLMMRTVAIVFSLTTAVFTQGIVTLLHEIEWDYLRVSELFILTIKEGLPSIPIILNLSLVIAWVTIKKELYQKKEVHALWLSGWTTRSTLKLVVSSLFSISALNTFILCVLAPSIRDLGPTKNTDWIHALSNQDIKHTFSVSAAMNKVLVGKGISEHRVMNPIFIEFDERWNVFHSAYATVNAGTIDLVDLHSVLAPKELSSLSISKMSIPILESPVVIAKEFHSLQELIEKRTPKMIGEVIWRIGLIILPWFVLLPFMSLAPNLQYRRESSGELAPCLAWFSFILILLFIGSKLPVILLKG